MLDTMLKATYWAGVVVGSGIRIAHRRRNKREQWHDERVTVLDSLLPLLAYRVPREEQMMSERFGAAYSAYRRRTGRFIPRLLVALPCVERFGSRRVAVVDAAQALPRGGIEVQAVDAVFSLSVAIQCGRSRSHYPHAVARAETIRQVAKGELAWSGGSRSDRRSGGH